MPMFKCTNRWCKHQYCLCTFTYLFIRFTWIRFGHLGIIAVFTCCGLCKKYSLLLWSVISLSVLNCLALLILISICIANIILSNWYIVSQLIWLWVFIFKNNYYYLYVLLCYTFSLYYLYLWYIKYDNCYSYRVYVLIIHNIPTYLL